VIHLTITEGKYHQVKLMAKAVGNEVAFNGCRLRLIASFNDDASFQMNDVFR
jgi:hypothetical protein